MKSQAERLVEAFTRAKALPTEMREGFLSQFSRELRAEIMSLLQADEDASNYLPRMDPGPSAPFLIEGLGDRIGPYKLLQQIGEGGCGVVYLAQQESPVRRRVALKVIKLGMDTRQVVARFEAERQALALMDHPSIARVLEAGATESGRPYFVMELVRGIRITDYCDQAGLSIVERLRLFVQVCHAIQHAHQKGIIHRDIKPANILVTLHDGVPLPKVIDFGIAKATSNQPLTDKTVFTAFEQFMGTPAYMSPEQAEVTALDIDTGSDIYSLGVLLYELITGKTPFDSKRLTACGLSEMRRIIREQEPPRPSTRLSMLSVVELSSAAARRNADASKLFHLVRGDLDWIVMKCLEKDRSRRYETANGLAMDLQRHLHSEPVIARPPSVGYRVRKLVCRHRISVLAAAMVMLTAVAGVLAITWQAVRATRAEHETKEALEGARRNAYFHHITLAHRELSADNLKGALELLGECPQDLRGWEWYYLMRLGRMEPVVLPDTNSVHSIAFHPDGQRVAAGCGDGTVKIWDLRMEQVTQTLVGHTRYVFSVAYRPPNGRFLASAGADRVVRIWDTSTGTEVRQHPGPVSEPSGMGRAVAYTHDGSGLMVGQSDGTVAIWDANRDRELGRLPEKHELAATSVASSDDGRFLATGSWGGILRIWDAHTHQLLHTSAQHEIRIGTVAFSSNGQWLASSSFDRTIKIWNPISGQLRSSWRAHEVTIPGIAWSPTGKYLASCGGEDKTVKLWDPDPGNIREILNLRGHTMRCECVAFSPDGLRLASGSADGTIRIWDASPLPSQTHESISLSHEGEVWSVAFSPDGRTLASGGWDQCVRLWDGQSGAPLTKLPFHGVVLRVAFSPDSRRIAVAAGQKRAPMIFVWDTVANTNVLTFQEPMSTHFFATFDPTGRYLLLEGAHHTIRVKDAQTGREVGTLGQHEWSIWSMAFSPDGRQLATASNEGFVKVWDWLPERMPQIQQPRFSLPVRGMGYGERLAFSRDGEYLLTGGGGTIVRIWNARTGGEVDSPVRHSGDVFALAFSRDGRWLASAGEDSTISIWDAKSWQHVRKLRGHRGIVMSLAFHPDGGVLASGSRDRTVRLWHGSLWEQGAHRR